MPPPTLCDCGTGENSAKQALMDCPIHDVACQILHEGKGARQTGESVIGDICHQQEVLRFMALTGIINVRAIITSEREARNEGYEL